MNHRIGKALRLAFLGALLVAVLVVSASATTYKTTINVNMRYRPRTSADVVKAVRSGAKVTYVKASSDGKWVKVSYGKKQGYIYKKYLKQTSSSTDNGSTDNSDSTSSDTSGATVTYPSGDLFDTTSDSSSSSSSGTNLGQFKLTFYCGCAACSEQWGTQTSTGATATQGRTIAVDPTVIPYGTKVHIDGFGDFVAEDCGGAIKGKHIDIYVTDHAVCESLGVQYADVSILS